jgi:mannosyltransferase OCH1-like enzyme
MNDAMQTWKDLNPEYEHRYMDDSQASDFVLKEFGKEWHDIFINVPVGVMRGDLWRYLIIYKYGGVYADLDTLCWKPISTWIKEDKDMIICPENNIHFCQWTFAATPQHPVIKSVLNCILQAFKNPNYNKPHFVHELTGPYIWTKGILSALEINDNINLVYGNGVELCNSSSKAKQYNFYCYGGEEWRIFHFVAVKHIYGSQEWNDGRYVQWIKDPLTAAYGAGEKVDDRNS